MSRYNISMPDELWAKVERAAAEEGAARGKPLPVSEWIRGLILEELGERLPGHHNFGLTTYQPEVAL